MYLIISRSDLTFVVNVFSQLMHVSRAHHHLAALRVLRYLKTTPGYGLFFSSSCSLQLSAFCGSDWASRPLTRQSTTGYIIKLGDSPLSWRTIRQPTVSRSSTEENISKFCMINVMNRIKFEITLLKAEQFRYLFVKRLRQLYEIKITRTQENNLQKMDILLYMEKENKDYVFTIFLTYNEVKKPN
ncbi:uncharacterized protein LOC111381108 [Olea europaea var. sylvestris]|uniref:uncharacterized protein LOC111381108 n=1 Tax=Olea europaea var. sylvestris TaxID=158386 RepID=UPI000C1D3D0A|nr:uncharacterized protein LOC111381108 [Olea europaea var. sylvestris]